METNKEKKPLIKTFVAYPHDEINLKFKSNKFLRVQVMIEEIPIDMSTFELLPDESI